MKKFYYLIAMAVMAFTFTSCEDVPEPYGQPTNPNSTTSVDPAGTGTADNPFNVAAAIAKCKEIGNTVSSEKYYIKGYAASAATAGSPPQEAPAGARISEYSRPPAAAGLSPGRRRRLPE